MTRSPSLCGIILAAGNSSRMGSDKSLLPWPPAPCSAKSLRGTFLGAHIAALSPLCDLVIVVAGNNVDLITPIVYSMGAFLVRNNSPELGQFSSLKLGLQDVLNRGRDSAIVSLVDRPPVQPATLAKLHQEYFAAIEEHLWGVVPEYEALMEALLRAQLTTTARDIMHSVASNLRYVPVDDPNVTLNINTPEDYAALPQVTSE
jgi:molybdenum cofactor cytidylyltransferase